MKYERGILVDMDGFFLRAFRWEEGTPAPNFPTRKTRNPKQKFILLREEYALNNVFPGARWDFTPVREGSGEILRGGTWRSPPEKRWIVVARRDKPEIAAFLTYKYVWPDRLPALADDQYWVMTEPPICKHKKPLWHLEREEWFFPRSVAVVDSKGKTVNRQLIIDDCDAVVPEGCKLETDRASSTKEA